MDRHHAADPERMDRCRECTTNTSEGGDRSLPLSTLTIEQVGHQTSDRQLCGQPKTRDSVQVVIQPRTNACRRTKTVPDVGLEDGNHLAKALTLLPLRVTWLKNEVRR